MNNTHSEKKISSLYTIIQFVNFLKDNNVISSAIASVISERVSDLVDAFISGFILPILEQDNDGDGKADIVALENKTINIGKIKLKSGKFIVALIKFIIITYVIFIISKVINNVKLN